MRLPAAKAVLNRLLLIQSYAAPGAVHIEGTSEAEDVRCLREGLWALKEGRPVWCGAGGTVLRFLAVRASRLPGCHVLRGTARLLSRPLEPLLDLLLALGVRARRTGEAVIVESEGRWSPPPLVSVDLSRSSQFASALVLNAWELATPLRVRLSSARRSRAYLALTLSLVGEAGLAVQAREEELTIPAGARVQPGCYRAEPDLGAAFALAAAGAVAGGVRLPGLPRASRQPDARFLEFLEALSVPHHWEEDALRVHPASQLRPVVADLGDTPDLFPVLAVLCALAPGRSRLAGAPHLRFKESDRIARVAALLRGLGRTVRILPDGLEIEGRSERVCPPFTFDPDQDHRLAMAAGVAARAGFPVTVTDPGVVAKSYPSFWADLALIPAREG